MPSGSARNRQPSRSSKATPWASRCCLASSRVQERRSSKPVWSCPGCPPSISSSAYGSSSQERSARPSSRERSVSPNWIAHRGAASSTSATRSATWSMRRRAITRPPFRRQALGLVLGDRERHVERVGRHLQLVARARQVDVPGLDGVGQPPEAGDLHLDDVADLHRARVRRRAAEQHVAGLERDDPAEVRELVGHGEQQVVHRGLLHGLAVHDGAEREARRVELRSGHELRAHGEEAVLPLDPQHRPPVGVAEVVQPDVVGRQVARDVVERLVLRDALHAAADDAPRTRPRS